MADAVGVSRSTVSNAYSRPDQLSSALRERILAAARQLGCPGPNPTARSLRRGFVGSIGVLFTSQLSYAFTDPFAVRLLAGVGAATERHGTSMLLVPLPQGQADARRAVENAAVDGFCVYCVAGEEWALASSAHVAGLGHRRVALLVDSVRPDAPAGPVTLAGFEQATHPTTRGRLAGFADAFAEVGVAWSELTLLNAPGDSGHAASAAVAGLFDRPEPPTAVLAGSDVLALGVLDALARRPGGTRQPVSVTGFDDVPEAAAAGLTTVRQPAQEKGRIADRIQPRPVPRCS
ncbi:substrate-binding domain-containing protein [Micromonospora sp. NPDC049102]|uniref:substrate-binding domain-containing protein n=1 Tax=Micromonospora sp. NPDC049102 TaxID=3364265 RepID=UPI003715591F